MTSCADCPDLDTGSMPPGWKPRWICCRDEHIQRRRDGSFEQFPGIEKARADWDHPAQPEPKGPNRRERRAAESRERKAK